MRVVSLFAPPFFDRFLLIFVACGAPRFPPLLPPAPLGPPPGRRGEPTSTFCFWTPARALPGTVATLVWARRREPAYGTLVDEGRHGAAACAARLQDEPDVSQRTSASVTSKRSERAAPGEHVTSFCVAGAYVARAQETVEMAPCNSAAGATNSNVDVWLPLRPGGGRRGRGEKGGKARSPQATKPKKGKSPRSAKASSEPD